VGRDECHTLTNIASPNPSRNRNTQSWCQPSSAKPKREGEDQRNQQEIERQKKIKKERKKPNQEREEKDRTGMANSKSMNFCRQSGP
jgi:hypothetical protein